MAEEKFNVHQFFVDDSSEHVASRVPAQVAVSKARQLSTSVGARIGTTKRVIVTDNGDITVLEWVHGKGLIFPVSCSNPKCTEGVLADTPCKKCGTVTPPGTL